MPKVVIELQANTQAAIGQIQQFAKAQQDAFAVIRAGTPAIADATIKVTKLTETTGFAAKGAQAANTALRTLASQGIAQVANEIPGVGGALSALGQTLGTFPLLIGAVVGAGLGLLKMLQGWNEEADKTLRSMTKLSEGIETTFRQSLREVSKIRAQAAGDDAKVIQLGVDQELAAAEAVKQGRIQKAREELDQRNLLGIKRSQLSKEGLAEINAAEAEYASKRLVIEAKAAAESRALEKKRGEERLAWLDKEIARMQTLEDASRSVARAQVAATLTAQAAAATRGGDPVAAARAQYAQQTEALRQSLEDQIAAQARALERGEMMDTEFAERRRALMDLTAQQQATLTAQFVRDQESAFASIDRATRQLLETLGPGFEDVTEKLKLGEAAEDSRAAFQTINAAFTQGRLSASDAAEAVRRVTENLTAQGVAIDDIARVVPTQLQNLSGLFRHMRVEIEATATGTEQVQHAMNQLSDAPLVTLTHGWFAATDAADSYRLKVLEIARLGPIAPVPALAGGGGVIAPQAGASPEGRRELMAAVADDQRRGLYE